MSVFEKESPFFKIYYGVFRGDFQTSFHKLCSLQCVEVKIGCKTVRDSCLGVLKRQISIKFYNENLYSCMYSCAQY